MARYGIRNDNALGISMPRLRGIAREVGRDHQLAQGLWDSGIHEARILAGLIDDPGQVTPKQMESWVSAFDSWDLCDQVCGNLFDRTPYAFGKAIEWSNRKEEFVKRAGFVLIAELAVHNKKASDDLFEAFLPAILRESSDERNFVKKAVNWALRQIGKRNCRLNIQAIRVAEQMALLDSRSAHWCSANALRELTNVKVQNSLKN
jgi:3-methyladenine DNA glycosylase AlkD